MLSICFLMCRARAARILAATTQSHMLSREIEEIGPVRLIRMAARMLPERDSPVAGRVSMGGYSDVPRPFLPSNSYTGSGAGARVKCAFRIHPAIASGFGIISAFSGAEEDRARRAQRRRVRENRPAGRSSFRDRHISENCPPSNGIHRSRRRSRRSRPSCGDAICAAFTG